MSPRAELVVITGPNGHGKTTLLRVLSGLVPAWKGGLPALDAAALGVIAGRDRRARASSISPKATCCSRI